MNRRFVSFASSFSVALALSGCSLLVEDTLSNRGGLDAGMADVPLDTALPDAPTAGCGVAPDGTRCAVEGLLDLRICVEGACVPARCGDGFIETRMADGGAPPEICDDGNGISGDGCDADCTYSCTTATATEDCDDDLLCNGTETCDEGTHACARGSDAADGTECVVEGFDTTCMSGICRAGVCPNGETEPGEDCDDDNATDGDGCDADCTFTCAADTDCQNETVCDGAETCDITTHLCVDATTLNCDDGDSCTTDLPCDATAGCRYTSLFVDADGDGFTVAMAGAPASCVSEDCDDTNMAAYPGAPEACGTVDLNCDGSTSAPTYYVDCDSDGYAATGAQTMMSCSPPTTRPSSCPGGLGAWVTRAPTGTNIDCADNDARAFPRTSLYYAMSITGRAGDYDFDCDGDEETQLPVGRPTRFTECAGNIITCDGTAYLVPGRSGTVGCGSQVLGSTSVSHCEVSGGSCRRVVESVSAVPCQ